MFEGGCDRTDFLFDKCDCACHGSSAYMHIIACCETCTICKEDRIKYMRLHNQIYHRDEHLKEN